MRHPILRFALNVKVLLPIGLTFLFLAGCELNPLMVQKAKQELSAAEKQDTTGELSFLVSEGEHMIAASGTTADSGQTKPEAPDTTYAFNNITPPAWDSTCGCHIRTETYTTSLGYSRVRIDSIFFKDADGKPLKARNFAKLKSLHHTRWVSELRGKVLTLIHFQTDMTLSIGADTLGTWNGTIAGTFNGEPFKSGTITNVVRKFTRYHWSYPLSGTVFVDRPSFSHEILYLGDGQAKVTRTNKKTGKVVITLIDRDFHKKSM